MRRAILGAAALLLMTFTGCVGKDLVVSPFLVDMFDPGLAIIHVRNLEWQSSERSTKDLKSEIDIHSTRKVIWFPLIHLMCDHGPYQVQVYVDDQSSQYQEIEINEIVIEYEDGEVVREKVAWTGVLPEAVVTTGLEEAKVNPAGIKINESVGDFPRRIASGKVSVIGCLIKPSGERVPFQSTNTYKAHHSLKVWPYFLVLCFST